MSAAGILGDKRKSRRRVKLVFYGVGLVLMLFYISACVGITAQSERDEARPADAIVVFGAAEYAGRPSPVFRARLDHAYKLFDRELAPVIIVSGGSGKDPVFTEGGVGRDYLISRGVTDRQLIAETHGDNTSESAERVATIMKANGWSRCIAVSDGYHLFRIKRMLARHGIEAYVSPRPQEAPVDKGSQALTVMREALSYLLWTLHIT